ncbi:SDR family oxidoreductase [Phytohabitans flavus]|uniref:SDR family oxidoreductase n=1 Tax=Phytohabitans flavus TaxID=1076124 RepID=UPI0031F17E1A
MTDNNTLSGRVAVVTGATSGIGAATARRLASAGASVALLGRREDRLKGLADEIGTAAVPVAVDITDQDAVYAAAATIRSALGPVDLVVANAGVMLAAPFESAQTIEWDQMIGTNLNGLLYTARAFVDDLLATAADGKAADLVLVGSVGGHQVFPNYAVYTATKAAVAHLTRGLRADFGPRGVRVKNIQPGFVGTELGSGMLDSTQREVLAGMLQAVPPLPPEDIADAIAYATAAPARVNVAELIVVPTVQG